MNWPDVDLASAAFWVCGSIMVVLALGMVLARKTVHAALCLVGLMVAMGVLYATLSAPFLFVAQLLVYTGSVMMLFLFTMMLIGVDTASQMKETIKGHRFASIVAAAGLGALLLLVLGNGIVGDPVGVGDLNEQAGGNAQALAGILFGRFAVAFEAASGLVITAALAAMVLSHAHRTAPKERQRDRMVRRLAEFAAEGTPLTPEPSPGVYAHHNAATYPALLPTGAGAPGSVAEALVERGQDVVASPALAAPVAQLHNQLVDQAANIDSTPMLRAPEMDTFAALPPGGIDEDPAQNTAQNVALDAAQSATPRRGA